jgi:hypothetical protein|tara:strand:+ start:450 stop:644 length:195 start_codon:yes stop_codon:yes gene_type:complete
MNPYELITDQIEDEVIRKELPLYFKAIISEIRQFENGGFFERDMIKRQLRRIEDLLDNRIDFEE